MHRLTFTWLFTILLAVTSAASQGMECVGRSKNVNDCPNPIFKVGSYQQNGKTNKRMFCVCQADFSDISRPPETDAEAIQQKMEIDIWSKRFQLTPKEFKTLVSR